VAHGVRGGRVLSILRSVHRPAGEIDGGAEGLAGEEIISGWLRGIDTGMTEEAIQNYEQDDATKPSNLREAVEVLRERFLSIRVETAMGESDTAVSVRFLGDEANLEERRLLVKNLVHYLPPALSIIGVKTGQEQDNENNG
jgi:hypothetical protein